VQWAPPVKWVLPVLPARGVPLVKGAPPVKGAPSVRWALPGLPVKGALPVLPVRWVPLVRWALPVLPVRWALPVPPVRWALRAPPVRQAHQWAECKRNTDCPEECLSPNHPRRREPPGVILSVENPLGFFNAKEETSASLRFCVLSGRLTDQRYCFCQQHAY